MESVLLLDNSHKLFVSEQCVRGAHVGCYSEGKFEDIKNRLLFCVYDM